MADVRAAGYRKVVNEGGVAGCLDRFDEGEASPKVKQFQTMMRPPPGARTAKWNDPPFDSSRCFGIVSENTSAAELLSPRKPTRFQEAVSASKVAKLKVDNKAPNVMEFLPGDTTFGRATLSASTAKECLWPVRQEGEAEYDEEEVRTTFYLKSHNRTNPGEQTSREYNQTYNEASIMGKATPSNPQGELVAKTLRWQSGKDENTSKMVSERHRAFEAGEHRKGGETALPTDSVFGHPSLFDGESVSALLTTGNDDTEDIVDLTETAAGNGEERGYNPGWPTIRTDILPPARVSVSDTKNYGDQGSVATVLAPSKLTLKGISVRDFSAIRSKGNIKAIFEAAELNKSLDFEAVWAEAAGEGEAISIADFQATLSAR